MDKNEYNLKLQEIDRYVDLGNTAEAAKIADTIDWKRVRNVRTLCMISEIYEAEGRYQDSKDLLLRAYRRSPVGRAILYRLVEVTIHLKQFDEAIEYYSEYVQAAPHDNNKYVLKYKIYKGRGSSVEEQIDILKEYLDQEYNEKYAYELAKLYQQADRISDCLTTCDDLVLWFHSGKYVIKALELKAKYAQLTPKQQEIYDHRFDDIPAEDEIGSEMTMVGPEDGSVTETIMHDAEREIAREVAAAAKTTDENSSRAFNVINPALAETADPMEETGEPDNQPAERTKDLAADLPTDLPEDLHIPDFMRKAGETPAQEQPVETEPAEEELKEAETADQPAEEEPEKEEPEEEEPEKTEEEESEEEEPEEEEPEEEELEEEELEEEEPEEEETEEEEPAEEESEAEEPAEEAAQEQIPYVDNRTPEQIQEDVARGVRELTAGIGIRDTIDENELLMDEVIEASKKDQEAAQLARGQQMHGITMQRKLTMPEFDRKKTASQLTIDDILLSMGERGEAVREAAAKAQSTKKPQAKGVLSAVDEALLNMGVSLENEKEKEEEPLFPEGTGKALAEAFAEPLAKLDDTQSVTTELPKVSASDKVTLDAEDLEEILTARTRRIPTDTIARLHAQTPLDTGAEDEPEEAAEEPVTEEPAAEEAVAEKPVTEEPAVEAVAEEPVMEEPAAEAEEEEPAAEEPVAEEPETEDTAAEESPAQEGYAKPVSVHLEMPERPSFLREDKKAVSGQTPALMETQELPEIPETDAEQDEVFAAAARALAEMENDAPEPADRAKEITPEPEKEEVEEETAAVEAEIPEEEAQAPVEGAKLKPYQREFFAGYIGIQNMESQIAEAIEQALAKGTDRTSRTGNILIFGGHGCGKTTIAIGIAKAIAQERGEEYVKMARIYATDLNRKDIAATIAKIAGGILIVEEAGDLEDQIVDQLTTAMEFRTDGTILILEDEQKYLHDLLMRHPRFTMKFTSQIFIPVFTVEELVRFGAIYADQQDYVMNEGAQQVLRSRLGSLSEQGEPLSISSVLGYMDKAILRANKFTRKLFAGKKRFDENGRVILLEKDF